MYVKKQTMYFTIVLQLTLYNCLINAEYLNYSVCSNIRDDMQCEYDFLSKETNVINIIEAFGYPTERHKVQTSDGYILTVFRIPNRFAKRTVFLHHVWQFAAINFFGRGRDSLLFLLVKAGHDVWLTNARGNKYSQEHVNLSVKDAQFWKYSEDEIALHDLPATLKYIHELTGQNKKIIYIGYSMGTTVGLMYSVTFPEEAHSMIEQLILLGPSVKLTNTKAPIFRYFNLFFRPVLAALNSTNLLGIASQGDVLSTLGKNVCLQSPTLSRLCLRSLNMFFAGPYSQMDEKTIPVYLNQSPAGGSFQLLVHLGDFVMDNFRRYDYGIENFEKYGTRHPSEYDLSRLTVPVSMFYAINDWDSIVLYNSLPAETRSGIFEIEEPNFNHLDFMYGRNVRSLVYEQVLAIINNLN